MNLVPLATRTRWARCRGPFAAGQTVCELHRGHDRKVLWLTTSAFHQTHWSKRKTLVFPEKSSSESFVGFKLTGPDADISINPARSPRYHSVAVVHSLPGAPRSLAVSNHSTGKSPVYPSERTEICTFEQTHPTPELRHWQANFLGLKARGSSTLPGKTTLDPNGHHWPPKSQPRRPTRTFERWRACFAALHRSILECRANLSVSNPPYGGIRRDVATPYF
jgi:hypothetical protein